MKFGISPLSLEFMINNVLKEQGVKELSNFRLSEVVEEIAKVGFNHCEISLDIFQILPIQITEFDQNKIAIENIEFPLEATIKIVKELNTKLCILL